MPYRQLKYTLPSKYAAEYQGTGGLAWDAICENTAQPARTDTAAEYLSSATTAPIVVAQVDPGACWDIKGEVGSDVDAVGTVFRIWLAGVTEAMTGLGGAVYNPTVKKWTRTPLAELLFTGGEADAIFIPTLTATAANVVSAKQCHAITITADYTINDSIRVYGNATDGSAGVTGDYGQHEWIEAYISCSDAVGVASASAACLVWRTL